MIVGSKIRFNYKCMVKSSLPARKANAYFIFRWKVFTFSIMIAFGVLMTTNVSDHRHDLELDKCKGQMYLNYILLLVTRTLAFNFL